MIIKHNHKKKTTPPEENKAKYVTCFYLSQKYFSQTTKENILEKLTEIVSQKLTTAKTEKTSSYNF